MGSSASFWTVTIKNCAVNKAGFKINSGSWNYLNFKQEGEYGTWGPFTGYVKDEAATYDDSFRTAMDPGGYYCIAQVGDKVTLVDKTSCDAFCGCAKSAMQAGFCVKGNGADQNSGVVKLNSVNVNTADERNECYDLCMDSSEKVTGCEVIWDQSNRGCYRHTHEVDRGNGVDNHYCWIC